MLLFTDNTSTLVFISYECVCFNYQLYFTAVLMHIYFVMIFFKQWWVIKIQENSKLIYVTEHVTYHFEIID